VSPAALLDIAREWLRAFNARELDALLALYDPAAVHLSPKLRERRPETGGRVAGEAALRAWWADAFRTLEGLRYEPVTLTADGERVWMEYRRVLPGAPDLMVAEVLVVRGGRIVESRVYHG
jgi:ketosteroid isomerase-like protein